MDNATHIITFYFGVTGSQQQLWNCSPKGPMEKTFSKKYGIKDLANDVAHDLQATSHTIEHIS